MSESSLFLIKRRYSVPEAIMRKHKLQELGFVKPNSSPPVDVTKITAALKPVIDEHESEVCQTNESPLDTHPRNQRTINDFPYRTNKKNKKREIARFLRKSNSYCQYKSLSLSRKRILARRKDRSSATYSMQSLTDISYKPISPFTKNSHSFEMNRYTGSKGDCESDIDYTLMAQKNHLNNERATNATSNQLKAFNPEFSSPTCWADQRFPEIRIPVGSDGSSTKNGSKAYEKRLDQNTTSGYNTLSENTPRHYSAESSNASLKYETSDNIAKPKGVDQVFPITLQSESIFLHPYQTGYLSHKEQHHISIDIVPIYPVQHCDTKEYFRTQVKMGVTNTSINEANSDPLVYKHEHSCEKSYSIPPENTLTSRDNVDYVRVSGNTSKGRQTVHTSEIENTEKYQQREKLPNSHCPSIIITSDGRLNSTHTEAAPPPKCAKAIDSFSSWRSLSQSQTAANRESQTNPFGFMQKVLPSSDRELRRPTDLRHHHILSTTSSSAASDDDCSVPTPSNFSSKMTNETQKLKIQLDVGNVNSSTNLENMLLSQNLRQNSTSSSCTATGQPPPNKHQYNSKMALSYLFQKLGDSNPRRTFLKKPISFADSNSRTESQFGRYYSSLPKLSDISSVKGTPTPLRQDSYNNQKYNILNENPPESNRGAFAALAKKKKVDYRYNNVINEQSDSDISIADSLEDVQLSKAIASTSTTVHANKYHKYDDKLARGDVPSERAQESKPGATTYNNISYFLSFENDGADSEREISHVIPNMPAGLKEKLNKRSGKISKHLICVESTKKFTKNRKLVRKQMQTCLNGEENLKKRCKHTTTTNLNQCEKPATTTESTLDEKIATILMTGLRLQEGEHEKNLDPSDESSKHKGSSNKITTTNQFVQTDDPTDAQSTLSEYMETYHFTTPMSKSEESGEQAENSSCEMILSEEEIERINTSNYYRAFKKSKRIYYPTKTTDSCHDHGQLKYQSTFKQQSSSKYKCHKKLKDIRQQVRKQTEIQTPTPTNNEAESDKTSAQRSVTSRGNSSAADTGTIFRKSSSEKTNFKVKNSTSRSKIGLSGSKSGHVQRFRQKFEAIPEEMTNSFNERHDTNGNCIQYRRTEDEDTKPYSITTNDEARNDAVLNNNINLENSPRNDEISDQGDLVVEERRNPEQIQAQVQCKSETIHKLKSGVDVVKSQKGKDSLGSTNAQDELITLSKGWINFYLLRTANTIVDGAEKTVEDENLTLSEKLYLPEQYTLHVQAVPQMTKTTTPPTQLSDSFKSTLPELYPMESPQIPQKWEIKREKSMQLETKPNLPNISKSKPSWLSAYGSNSSGSHDCDVGTCHPHNECSSGSPLPNLQITDTSTCKLSSQQTDLNTNLQSDCFETLRSDAVEPSSIPPSSLSVPVSEQTSTTTSTATFKSFKSIPISSTPVTIHLDSSVSSTSSNHCESPNNEASLPFGRIRFPTGDRDGTNRCRGGAYRNKKVSRNQKLQTYNPTRKVDGGRWSLVVEGNHECANKKNATSGTADIEMRLLVKNCSREDDPRHSWKFTFTNADSSVIEDGCNPTTHRYTRPKVANCLPNVNVNYRISQQALRTHHRCRHNQNRVLRLSSCSETASRSTSICSFDEGKCAKDENYTPGFSRQSRSDNDLIVTGSTITRESKRKPLTMSERDLTRMRLVRNVTAIASKPKLPSDGHSSDLM